MFGSRDWIFYVVPIKQMGWSGLTHRRTQICSLGNRGTSCQSNNAISITNSPDPFSPSGVAYNVAEVSQMGWNSPTRINGMDLTLGATITLNIPAGTRSSRHGVVISPDWYGPIVFLV